MERGGAEFITWDPSSHNNELKEAFAERMSIKSLLHKFLPAPWVGVITTLIWNQCSELRVRHHFWSCPTRTVIFWTPLDRTTDCNYCRILNFWSNHTFTSNRDIRLHRDTRISNVGKPRTYSLELPHCLARLSVGSQTDSYIGDPVLSFSLFPQWAVFEQGCTVVLGLIYDIQGSYAVLATLSYNEKTVPNAVTVNLGTI